MLFEKWSQRSLRSWIALGMALTLLPLVVSAAIDHVILNRGVIAEFQDISLRYRTQIGPTQRLRLDLWEASTPLNEYLGERDAKQIALYRALRIRIEDGFAHLRETLKSEATLVDLLERARTDWSAADRIASDLFSRTLAPVDVQGGQLVDQFDGLMASLDDKLQAVGSNLDADLDQDHTRALQAYERTEWLAGIGAAVALLMMLAGVVGVGRIMVINVERLIEGARKFADGDRTHRIDVQVPPELRRVADEFNRMVERIHASEAALAEEAREDVLTGLANRRAFDEALAEAFARMRRLGETVPLVLLDIDYFKKVNDTYGHAVGDQVLQGFAQTVKSGIREVDKAFRIGGEEFAVLMAATDTQGAQVGAERLRSAVEASRFPTDHGELTVTTSVGIAFGHKKMRPDELQKAADAALYLAKSTGRNRVVVADPHV